MAKKPVILFGLPSFHVGGIERQLLQQFRYFDNNKYDFHLITLFLYSNKPTLFNELPAHIRVHPLRFQGYWDFASWHRLINLLKSIRPNLVVSSMFSANACFRILRPFFGYKCITREHNTYTDRRPFHRMADHVLSRLSSKIVAVSQGVAEYVSRQSWIPLDWFTVINNGVDVDEIDIFRREHQGQEEEIMRKFGLDVRKRYIVNVARLKPQKNQRLLIDAFSGMARLKPDWRLLIVGDGVEESNLQRHADKLGLGDKVRILGYRPDVFSLYLISEFFALTSKIEGFPNVCIEAMAFGLPVISTPVAGVPEIIREGENGFLVKPDPHSLEEKMLYLVDMSEDEKNRFRQSCLTTARSFNIRKIVKRYELLFDEVLVS